MLFVLVFACGLAIGTAATDVFLHSRMHNTAHAAQSFRFEQLKSELQLTPYQQAVIRDVLDDYRKYYQNLEDDRESVAEHGKQQILSVLNPEQKKKFLEMFSEPALPGKQTSR